MKCSKCRDGVITTVPRVGFLLQGGRQENMSDKRILLQSKECNICGAFYSAEG